MTASSVELVNQLLERGNSLQRILDLSGHQRARVIALAAAHGYGFTDAGKPYRLALSQAVTAPAAAATVQLEAVPPAEPDVVPDTAATVDVDQVLRLGFASETPRLRALACKAQDTIDALRKLLAEQQEKEAARVARIRAEREARAEVDRLTKQLAAAKAKLKPARVKPGSPAAAAATTGSPKAVRAWAAAAGVDCPGFGRVPRAVVEQYEASVAS